MTREEEVKQLCKHLANVWNAGANRNLEALFEQAVQWADEHPKNPWREAKTNPPKEGKEVFAHVPNLCGGEYCKLTYLGNYRWSQDEGEWTTEFYNNEVRWMPIPEGGETMREIKFRGKKLCQDEWIYGSLITRGERGADGNFIDTGRGHCFPLQQDTIGQYTGLKDKNGEEIYEGDIVHLDAWEPDTMQIAFIEGAFCLADANGNYLGDIHYIHHAGVEQCTIVGNIYDNSKLLKEDEV